MRGATDRSHAHPSCPEQAWKRKIGLDAEVGSTKPCLDLGPDLRRDVAVAKFAQEGVDAADPLAAILTASRRYKSLDPVSALGLLRVV